MGTQLSKNNGSYLYSSNPKQDLMKILVNKTQAAGHLLSFKEANQDPEMVNPNNYAYYYGSFSEAANLAWKEVLNPRPKESTSNPRVSIPNTSSKEAKLKQLEPSKPNFRMKEKEKTNSRTSKYTHEQVKGQVIAFYRRNGRMPTQTDAVREPSLPSWATLCKHLGPKSEWTKLIPPSIREESFDTKDNVPSTEVGAKPNSAAESTIAAPKAIITTQQHWEDEVLMVEFEVFKPGSKTPIHITLSV